MNNEHKDYYRAVPISTEFTYDLDDEVTDVGDYRELISLLRYAGEDDVVRININNYGGQLPTCIAIVNAIRSCKALTVGVLSSVAYSAAGAIWMACQAQEVGRHCGFMAHPASGGDYGTLHQRKQAADHTLEMLRSLYEDVYEGFLTKEEIESILKSDDLWLNEKDIRERLEKRDQYFQQLESAAEAEADRLIEEMFAPPSPEVLKKLTKQQLIDLISGEIGLDEEGNIVEADGDE